MNVLAVFAKRPIAGRVKTRLAEALGPAMAADIYAAFLGDLLERFRQTADERVVCFTPSEAGGYFQALAGEAYKAVPQGTGNLGARMQRFFATYLQTNREGSRVVVIGSDSPTLPRQRVESAFELLAERDVVLGPATDGGYYLIGCRRLCCELFERISWGTADVLGQTIAAMPAAGCKLAILDPWYDVDTLESWRMLEGHVAALRRAGLNPEVPLTEALRRGRREPSR